MSRPDPGKAGRIPTQAAMGSDRSRAGVARALADPRRRGEPADDTMIKERTRPRVSQAARLKRPPRYRVLLHNDDYTPREFVVLLLKMIFHRDESEARLIMLKAHRTGIAVAGVYTREIAETKATQVVAAAEEAGHPLLCTTEPDSDGDEE